MIDDGTKENGRDDIVVQDISMHLVDALERRDAPSSAGDRQPAAVGADVHQPGEHGDTDSDGVA
jgi:hypothetical protein